MVARRIALLGAGLAVALALPACGDDGGPRVASLVEGTGTYQQGSPQQAAQGATVVQRVGAELYAPLVEAAGDANVAYSPLSIASVLAMTRVGAQGASAEQIDALLGTDGDGPQPSDVMAAAEAVQDQTGPVELANGDMAEVELADANAMWGQSGVEWRAPFLDDLTSGFDTGMWTVDYAADPEAARHDINDWVAEHTREHITELLPEGSIGDDTRLTLTNAIWFAAPWPDDLIDVGVQPFTTASKAKVDAPMVRATGQLPYREGDGWESVTLPYGGGKLAMTFILPDDETLDALDSHVDAELLRRATAAESRPSTMHLTFPKLDLDQRARVGEALRELGVRAPFDTDSDFEPMTTDEAAQPLHLADVVHQATVTVDEHGTEAAAATAATFETVGAPITDTEVTIDRPYLFVIHDLGTGTPLFIGRVTDPTKP
jgi:serpin B